MSIGQEILVLRAEKGWTQKQFADKLKTSQRTVVAWEAGKTIPRKTMMVKIAQVFGLPINTFLDSKFNVSEAERIEKVVRVEKKLQGKGDTEGIEDKALNTYQEMREEKKRILEVVREFLCNIEER